jgi:hypothetical protein
MGVEEDVRTGSLIDLLLFSSNVSEDLGVK